MVTVALLFWLSLPLELSTHQEEWRTEHQIQIDLAGVLESNEPSGPVLFRGKLEKGTNVVLFRRDGLTMRAWRRKDRGFLFDNIEAGIAKERRQYRLRTRKDGRIDGVPYLDLRFDHKTDDSRRKGHIRILFFRRYAMVLSIDGARRSGDESAIRKLVAGFGPDDSFTSM